MQGYSPEVTRMAMLLEELDEESRRAAYMVISDMHRLREELRELRVREECLPIRDDTTKKLRIQQKNYRKG